MGVVKKLPSGSVITELNITVSLVFTQFEKFRYDVKNVLIIGAVRIPMSVGLHVSLPVSFCSFY